ncbi:hypothetical protein [Ligilactobacillus araffinosus]|nr:hypothetical protein [Ligilactobacillus araffinosus]
MNTNNNLKLNLLFVDYHQYMVIWDALFIINTIFVDLFSIDINA